MIFTLTVSPLGSVVITPTEINEIGRNTMHVLTCLTKGGPGNAFRWKRVGANEVIAESSELVMIIADASSGGVYQCTVENMAGMDSDIATINGEKRVHYRAGRMEFN